ncbi:MAG: hypothetical protein P4M13_06535 [Alphaproteobacteria bacterium]|nr:hypothetical protein [Alphaproteobacteria bacterium]
MQSDSMPEMNKLVSDFDSCSITKGKLFPCKYLKDRVGVAFYEQIEAAGETEIDEKTISLTPTPALVDLFERMQQKNVVAGHWGLMAPHRNWLKQRISAVLRQKLSNGKPPTLRILPPVKFS